MGRMKGKQKVGFWFTKPEIELLKEMADGAGLTMSDIMRALIAEHAKKLVRRSQGPQTEESNEQKEPKGESK